MLRCEPAHRGTPPVAGSSPPGRPSPSPGRREPPLSQSRTAVRSPSGVHQQVARTQISVHKADPGAAPSGGSDTCGLWVRSGPTPHNTGHVGSSGDPVDDVAHLVRQVRQFGSESLAGGRGQVGLHQLGSRSTLHDEVGVRTRGMHREDRRTGRPASRAPVAEQRWWAGRHGPRTGSGSGARHRSRTRSGSGLVRMPRFSRGEHRVTDRAWPVNDDYMITQQQIEQWLTGRLGDWFEEFEVVTDRERSPSWVGSRMTADRRERASGSYRALPGTDPRGADRDAREPERATGRKVAWVCGADPTSGFHAVERAGHDAVEAGRPQGARHARAGRRRPIAFGGSGLVCVWSASTRPTGWANCAMRCSPWQLSGSRAETVMSDARPGDNSLPPGPVHRYRGSVRILAGVCVRAFCWPPTRVRR